MPDFYGLRHLAHGHKLNRGSRMLVCSGVLCMVGHKEREKRTERGRTGQKSVEATQMTTVS